MAVAFPRPGSGNVAGGHLVVVEINNTNTAVANNVDQA